MAKSQGTRVFIRLPLHDSQADLPPLTGTVVQWSYSFTARIGYNAVVAFDDGRENIMPHCRLTPIPKYRSIDDP